MAVGQGPDDSSRRRDAADLALRRNRARGLRPRRLLRTGAVRPGVWRTEVYRQARMLGAGGPMQRRQARLDGRTGRLRERGGICMGCTMPGFPDRFMPFMNQPAGSVLSVNAVSTYRQGYSSLAALHPGIVERRTCRTRQALVGTRSGASGGTMTIPSHVRAAESGAGERRPYRGGSHRAQQAGD